MDTDKEEYRAYWRANVRLIGGLLAIWASVSLLGGIVFVETLNKITFFSIPFGFWIAQQGSIYVFVVLIFFYAWRMNKYDRQYDVHED